MRLLIEPVCCTRAIGRVVLHAPYFEVKILQVNLGLIHICGYSSHDHETIHQGRSCGWQKVRRSGKAAVRAREVEQILAKMVR